MSERKEGRMDGWMDGSWMDGSWMDGWMSESLFCVELLLHSAASTLRHLFSQRLFL
jgi:hypothetical protein